MLSVTTTPAYVPIVDTNLEVRGNTRVADSGLQTEIGWVYRVSVGPDFFKTLGIPVLRGRDFNAGDRDDAPNVAIINESLARQSFPNADPIGKRFQWFANQTVEIVGVVRDVKHELRAVVPAVYVLDSQTGLPPLVSVHVRTATDADLLIPAIGETLQQVDPNVPRPEFQIMRQSIDDGLTSERLLASASTFFGGITLLLATIGLYGVASYGATRRTREFGIRMAFGAERRNVVWLIVRETLVLIFIGISLGLLISLGSIRLISSLLFGLQPTNLVALSVAALLIASTATFASYLPARRAARLDLTSALRQDD